MRRDPDLDRRRLLALCGGLAVTAALPGQALAQRKTPPAGDARPAAATPAPSPAAATAKSFFSKPELAMVDELAELIVPADARSGGGRAAKVAEFLDARLAESLDQAVKQSWRDDVAEINRLSAEMFGKSFMAASPAQRIQLLDRISRNEKNPKEPGEFAFATIKWQVTFVYYKTKIGIHEELDYRGNVLLDEFLGTDVTRP